MLPTSIRYFSERIFASVREVLPGWTGYNMGASKMLSPDASNGKIPLFLFSGASLLAAQTFPKLPGMGAPFKLIFEFFLGMRSQEFARIGI